MGGKFRGKQRWRGKSSVAGALGLLLAGLLLPGGVGALKHGRPVTIGVLTVAWGPTTPAVAGLRAGLVELGYRENEDFVFGTRFTSGDIPALASAARELVTLGADIIIAILNDSVLAAKRVTSSIPIVFAVVDDPVQAGMVISFARPGGNITGVAGDYTSLGPKQLEIFKKLIPGLRTVLFVYDGNDQGAVFRLKAYRRAGEQLGVKIVARAVRTEAEAQAAIEGVGKGDVGGILAPLNIAFNIPGLILQTASHKGIPTMFPGAFYLDLGGLASYAPGYYSSGRQAARLVKKIMRGVKPADIPVEVNNDIEFAVNLKTAKALGIKIPPEVLFQATRIVR